MAASPPGRARTARVSGKRWRGRPARSPRPAVLDRYQAIDPQKLCLTPGARLLDVGCGTGRHLLELRGAPGSFVGLDMSRDDLRALRYKLAVMERDRPASATITSVQGDGERLPFADGLFDC